MIQHDTLSLTDALKQAAQSLKQQTLTSLFAQDPGRAQKYTVKTDQLYLDFSKQWIDDEAWSLLLNLAEQQQIPQALQALFSGEIVNATEQRPALHTACRAPANHTVMVNGQNVMPMVIAERQKMALMVEKLHAQRWLGATGVPITDVVNIGIGGSDLGPLMAEQALADYRCSHIKLHFVSNIDPVAIDTVLRQVNPASTLFIVSSKSFGTPETLFNAKVAKQWLQRNLGLTEVGAHFIGVTTRFDKAQEFGIEQDNILTFWDWVGGRYSIWSSIGLPLAISIGMENYQAFLDGAHHMDCHTLEAPLANNMPVIMALLGYWMINYFKAPTLAVLPYAQGLSRFADYLQQLDMESNGKQVTVQGNPVNQATGPIVWGQAGTNGQHAFYQLLHQGTHLIPVDFILPAKTTTAYNELHQQLVANCLAQAQALMQGKHHVNSAHQRMQGNKPSNLLLLTQLSPYTLGQLIALYEHKVFIQGRLWGINSFDQPGVELGKQLAANLVSYLESKHVGDDLDPSTQRLIEIIQQMQQQ